VLRKRQGDSFEAGIIGGMAGNAVITRIDEKQKKLYFVFEAKNHGKPLYPVSVIIGFPRPIQLKRIFRDMAGLGADEIHLAGTELGEKSYMRSKMFERGTAEALLREGSAQAKSTHVPRLFLHQTLEECLLCITRGDGIIRAALDNCCPEAPLVKFCKEQLAHNGMQRVIAAVGNERGWTDNERALLKKAGFTLCGIGERVLRTETACAAAAALILSALEVL
jgi:RsmE family RNA methyltransferase